PQPPRSTVPKRSFKRRSADSAEQEQSVSSASKETKEFQGPAKKRIKMERQEVAPSASAAETKLEPQDHSESSRFDSGSRSLRLWDHGREHYERSLEQFVQDSPCSQLACAKLAKCRECRPAGQHAAAMAKSTAAVVASADGTACRFIGFRKLRYNKKGGLTACGFCESTEAEPEDLAAWLRKPPNGAAAAAAPGVVASEARRLLSFVGEAFQELASQERQLRARYGGAGGDGTNAASLWRRRDVGGVGRGNCGTACDQCDSTLFGAYFCCGKCGYALCPDCRLSDPAAAAAAAAASSSDRPATRLRPGGGVAAAGDCTVGRQAHEPDRLLLATNVPGDAFARLASAVASLRVPPLSPPESPPPPPPPVAADSPADPDAEAAYNRSLILRFSEPPRQADGPGCLAFQRHWRRGLPVVVANCLPAAAAAAADAWWHPRSLSRGLTGCRCSVLNCDAGTELPASPTRHFWDGFDSMKRRLKNPATGDPLSLRLRPPPASRSACRCPSSPRLCPGGRCNLAAGCAPPRLTCAYGMSRTETAGTFALHCQPADLAVLLAHVAAPEDALEQQKAAAFAALERASVDPGVLRSIAVDSRLPGALWHVFRPADAAKLRRFLAAGAENGGGNPLAEQTGTYVGPAELDRLRLKCGLRPAVIVQFQGDTVFVPAGAPYQVRNLHSGISLSVDFVSQESCRQCLATGREMRQHNRLPLRRLLYRAVRDAVSVLESTRPISAQWMAAANFSTQWMAAAHFSTQWMAAAHFSTMDGSGQFQHTMDGSGPFQHTMDGSGPFQHTMDGSGPFQHNGWQHPFQLQRNISDMQWHKAGGGHTMVPGQETTVSSTVSQRRDFSRATAWPWVKPASRQSPFTLPAVLVRRAAVDDALDDDGLRPGEAVGAANDGEAERAGAGVPGQVHVALQLGMKLPPPELDSEPGGNREITRLTWQQAHSNGSLLSFEQSHGLLVAEAQQRDVVHSQQYVAFSHLPGPGGQAVRLQVGNVDGDVAALGADAASHRHAQGLAGQLLNHHNPALIVGLIVHGIHGAGAGVSQVGQRPAAQRGSAGGEAGIARGQSRRGQLAAAQIREARAYSRCREGQLPRKTSVARKATKTKPDALVRQASSLTGAAASQLPESAVTPPSTWLTTGDTADMFNRISIAFVFVQHCFVFFIVSITKTKSRKYDQLFGPDLQANNSGVFPTRLLSVTLSCSSGLLGSSVRSRYTASRQMGFSWDSARLAWQWVACVSSSPLTSRIWSPGRSRPSLATRPSM
uniref:JmjC domain-containing protein n=1 Tax=Macrostomum lignano TaxID=282301 RepID=A0A1I8IPK8_9PLAT